MNFSLLLTITYEHALFYFYERLHTSSFILAIRQIICHWPFTKEITEIWLNDHNIYAQKHDHIYIYTYFNS